MNPKFDLSEPSEVAPLIENLRAGTQDMDRLVAVQARRLSLLLLGVIERAMRRAADALVQKSVDPKEVRSLVTLASQVLCMTREVDRLGHRVIVRANENTSVGAGATAGGPPSPKPATPNAGASTRTPEGPP